MNRKYAVIDLETTGGIPKRDKITEIAIILYDGQKIIDEFQTLVNPERSIPPNITRITGITNDMVAAAPKFYEIARRVVELTEGAIFVAHNVRFDYQFLREEFKALGFTFTKRNLCTVKMSRKAFPGLGSYSLGNLIKYFRIDVANRHRAYDDAWATTILLGKIFEQKSTKKDVYGLVTSSIKMTNLPPALTPADIDNLPEECGVYYFTDSEDRVIYVGKSINIQKRIRQHFSKQTRKADRLLQKATAIQYEITGSELLSLLLESEEIKKIQPEINRAQKTRKYPYAITVRQDKSGYLKYKVEKKNTTEEALSFYSTRRSAMQHIKNVSETYNLCLKVNEVEKTSNACFQYTLGRCAGACIGEEFPHSYNQKFEESLDAVSRLFEDDFIVLEQGIEKEKCIAFLVEDGHYRGRVTLSQSESHTAQAIRDQIKEEKHNPEADIIVRNYILTRNDIDIIYF